MCIRDSPFAARISTNAHEATKQAEIEIVRLERPPWQAEAGDIWHHVQSLEDAVTALPKNCTALVTIGRQQLGSFLDRGDVKVIARAIDAPSITVPDHWEIILARPPFALDDEIELIRSRKIDVLVTKNAGGNETREKLLAARQLQKPVIVFDRLPKPALTTYSTIDELLAAL